MSIPTALNHVTDELKVVHDDLSTLIDTLIKFRNRQKWAVRALGLMLVLNLALGAGIFHLQQTQSQTSKTSQQLLIEEDKLLQAINTSSSDSKDLVCDLVGKINKAADIDVTPEACKTS